MNDTRTHRIWELLIWWHNQKANGHKRFLINGCSRPCFSDMAPIVIDAEPHTNTIACLSAASHMWYHINPDSVFEVIPRKRPRIRKRKKNHNQYVLMQCQL